MVECMECGTVHDVWQKVCSHCFFPLPDRKKRAETYQRQTVPAYAPIQARAARVPQEPGHGALNQCYAVVLAAAILIWLNAASNLLFGKIQYGSISLVGFVLFGFAVLLGYYLVKGSAPARLGVIIVSMVAAFLYALGAGLVGGAMHVFGVPAGSPGGAVVAIFMGKLFYSFSLIALLTGRGSRMKAQVLVVANVMAMAAVFAFSAVEVRKLETLALMTPTESKELERANELVADRRLDAAADNLVYVIKEAKWDMDKAVLEEASLMLAQIYLHQGRPQDAVRCLEEAATYLPRSYAVRDLLASAYYENDQHDKANETEAWLMENDPAMQAFQEFVGQLNAMSYSR